jgi:hypothetical protein
MKRRTFIKSVILGAATLNIISMPQKPELRDNYIDIFTSEYLRSAGVRGALYSASMIDANGYFGHESDYDESAQGEPFVIMHSISDEMPKFSKGPEFVSNWVASLKESDLWNYRGRLIEECKTKMAYTSCVQYIRYPCRCGSPTCKRFNFSPIIRGMSIERYHRFLRKLNGPNYKGL